MSVLLAQAATNAFPENGPLPTRITRYRVSPDEIPVDFFADPDGAWEFASLVEMAGFDPEAPGASVGALVESFDCYPAGSAVVTQVGVGCRFVAIAQLPRQLALESSRVTERALHSRAFALASSTRAA